MREPTGYSAIESEKLLHLIDQINYFTRELQYLESCGNLDDTVIGTAEDYLYMKKKNLEKYISKVHHHAIWQENGGRALWRTKLPDQTHLTCKTKDGLYEKLFHFYAGEESFIYDRKQHTLKALFPRFMRWKNERTAVTGKTLKEYNRLWTRYFKDDPIANKRIEDISISEWLDFFERMVKANHLTKKKFMHIRMLPNGLYEFAIRKTLVEINRIRDVDYRNLPYAPDPNRSKVKVEAFTHDELLALRTHCYKELRNTRRKCIYPLAVIFNSHMGLRFGELAGLRWKDVNFKLEEITICGQLVADIEIEEDLSFTSNGSVRVEHLKSDEEARTLPLPQESIEILKRVRNLNLSREFVFPQGDFRYKTYRDKIKEYADAIGLEGSVYRPHSLRASVAVAQYLGSLDICLVQKWLGHTNPEMTAKYIKDYRDVKDLRANMERVEAMQKTASDRPKKPIFTLIG